MLVMRTAEIDRSFGEEIMRQIDKVVAREREAKKQEHQTPQRKRWEAFSYTKDKETP